MQFQWSDSFLYTKTGLWKILCQKFGRSVICEVSIELKVYEEFRNPHFGPMSMAYSWLYRAMNCENRFRVPVANSATS